MSTEPGTGRPEDQNQTAPDQEAPEQESHLSEKESIATDEGMPLPPEVDPERQSGAVGD